MTTLHPTYCNNIYNVDGEPKKNSANAMHAGDVVFSYYPRFKCLFANKELAKISDATTKIQIGKAKTPPVPAPADDGFSGPNLIGNRIDR